MKTVDTHGSFEDVVSGSSDEVKRIASRMRQLIVEVYPDVVEVPWPRQRIAGYGVGPKKMSEHFCYIGVHAHHVNLGFYYGVHLPDPGGMLEGSGKSLRHVKIKDIREVEKTALRKLVENSLAERKRALGMR
jgi:hypothetical protein